MISIFTDKPASIVATGGFMTIGMTIGGKFVAITMPSESFRISMMSDGVRSDGDCLADWIKNNK